MAVQLPRERYTMSLLIPFLDNKNVAMKHLTLKILY